MLRHKMYSEAAHCLQFGILLKLYKELRNKKYIPWFKYKYKKIKNALIV